MDEYYGLEYKSSPGKVSYILHRSENKLDFLGSLTSPKKRGIKLEDNGEIYVPKYFFSPVKIDKNIALELALKKGASKIEKLVEEL